MSGTMMHHGARVPVEVLKFNSLVLFSSEKSFTLSLPIQIGNELERGLVFLSEVSCKILLEPLSTVHGVVRFFILIHLFCNQKKKPHAIVTCLITTG